MYENYYDKLENDRRNFEQPSFVRDYYRNNSPAEQARQSRENESWAKRQLDNYNKK